MYKTNAEIKHRLEQTSGVTDVFSTLKNLEINIIDSCNRICDFCPHSEEDYSFNRNKSEISLAEIIASQATENNYKNSITVCGYGEPAMHKQLPDIIKILSTSPAKVELITNGELLNPEKTKQLFNQGLSFINISVYEEKYLNHALSLVKGLHESQYLIRTRYKGHIKIVNRKEILKNKINLRTEPCWLPSYKMIVNHNGDVMLCCNDWTRTNIFGNVYQENFKEIWINNLMDKRLELLKAKDIKGVCLSCNISGRDYGQDSANYYESNY